MRGDELYVGDFICWFKGDIFRFGYVLPPDHTLQSGYCRLAVRKLVDGIILSDDWEVVLAHARSITHAVYHIGSLRKQETIFPTIDGQQILNDDIRRDLQNIGVQFKNGRILEQELLTLLQKLGREAKGRTPAQISV